MEHRLTPRDFDFSTISFKKSAGFFACSRPSTSIASSRTPLRYSRAKTEDRAKKYGQVFLNQADATPEEWIADDKGMLGALRGYRYAEDP